MYAFSVPHTQALPREEGLVHTVCACTKDSRKYEALHVFVHVLVKPSVYTARSALLFYIMCMPTVLKLITHVLVIVYIVFHPYPTSVHCLWLFPRYVTMDTTRMRMQCIPGPFLFVGPGHEASLSRVKSIPQQWELSA